MGYEEMWDFLNGNNNNIPSYNIDWHCWGNFGSKVFSRTQHQPVGGTKGDGITNTQEFLKDVGTHMIKLLTVEGLKDKPETITFHVILGSNIPPILGNHYASPQHKTYTTKAVSSREYIENLYIT